MVYLNDEMKCFGPCVLTGIQVLAQIPYDSRLHILHEKLQVLQCITN